MKVIQIRHLEKSYSQELNEVCDKIYKWSDAKGWNWNELAVKAGLATATVYRLGNRVTKLPRFKTVYLLARAVGSRIELLEPRTVGLAQEAKKKA